MQVKDIDTAGILRFLARNPGRWHNWYFGDALDVTSVMPPGTPPRLVLAKMRRLIRRGLVSGCDCGCRGDFEITQKGLEFLFALDLEAA